MLLGRDRQRQELVELVTADVFRAGLLYGEPGVGKTSLLRAGLIPLLRDQGVVALVAEDPLEPSASLATGLSAFGIEAQPGEAATAFLARAVANAVPGKQFVFVIDDADRTCQSEAGLADLGDLFVKVAGRSGGRARFLFACASERMHALAHLERRTGSLFPPSNRIELLRMDPAVAASVFEAMLSMSALSGDRALVDDVIAYLARDGTGVLPADLQIAALALSARNLTSADALRRGGGVSELASAWIREACAASGNERQGLRLLAELVDGPHRRHEASTIAQRVSMEPELARHTLDTLEARGIVARCDFGGAEWIVRHEVLVSGIRDLTAVTRAAARRAYELLGSRTGSLERLTLTDLRKLYQEGIAPVTPQEQALVKRSVRHYATLAAIGAAIPLFLLIVIYISMSGNIYFSVEPRAGGDHVVIREGRAGLSPFHWMGFGDVIGDTGLTRNMVAPEAWKRIEHHDLGGAEGKIGDRLAQIMAPSLAGAVTYATDSSDQALDKLKKLAKEPEEVVELLELLQPIARGGRAETALIEGAILSPSPAVQRAAIMVAAAAAARRPDAYSEALTKALASANPEIRKVAIAAVRDLPADRAKRLLRVAQDGEIDAAARRDLQLESAEGTSDDPPPPSAIAAVLAQPDSTAAQRERAKAALLASLQNQRGATAEALAAIARSAPNEARIFALETLVELEPLPPAVDLASVARAGVDNKSEALRAAALPLFARIAPEDAAEMLKELTADRKLARSLKIAAAKAWGLLIPARPEEARAAVEALLRDDASDVRAAAAAAYGKLGRAAQEPLVKMVKNERFDVAVGAGLGLAATANEGGSPSVAVDGIAQLWKQKGRARREAVRIFAKVALTRPANVHGYLDAASRATDDPSLHPLAVRGLCNATKAGPADSRASLDARRSLARAVDDPSVEVRRLVVECVADGPEPAKNGASIALRLVRDPDPGIRAVTAQILASGASTGSKPAADGLVALADDQVRDVRIVALRGLAAFGSAVSEAATPVLLRAYDRGDEGERLVVLRAAKQLGVAPLMAHGIADSSVRVRIAAVEASLGAGLAAEETLAAALADPEAPVRRAALDQLTTHKDKLPARSVEKALAVTVRDADPAISQLALTTVARLAAKDAVASRLGRALSSRTERERAQAAAAAIGLVERDAALTAQLLEPLLADPSHDVRVALLPALAAAYAKTQSPERLRAQLEASELQSMKRLVISTAFLVLARTPTGAKAASEALLQVSSETGSLASANARLVRGLLDGGADGVAFLQKLVP